MIFNSSLLQFEQGLIFSENCKLWFPSESERAVKATWRLLSLRLLLFNISYSSSRRSNSISCATFVVAKMEHPIFYIERFFYWLGKRIGRYHIQIIVASLIFTSILSSGMVYFEENNNVRSEYSPLNAPSQKEYAVAKQFLKQVSHPGL